MWTCEICGRTFRRQGQSHSHDARTKEDAFRGDKVKWLPLYENLKARAVERLGPFSEYYPSVGVMWKQTSTFAEVKCKKDVMEIAFYSDRLHPEREPTRWLQTSTNRVAHLISVKDDRNFETILNWIVESYLLTQK